MATHLAHHATCLGAAAQRDGGIVAELGGEAMVVHHPGVGGDPSGHPGLEPNIRTSATSKTEIETAILPRQWQEKIP